MSLVVDQVTDSVPPPVDVPVVDLHPYDDEVLARPHDFADVWLNAGPIFWISRIGAFGVARHTDVVAVMKDWQHFSSEGGVGLTDKTVSRGSYTPSLLLEADPPRHTGSRAIMNRIFSASALKPLVERWNAEADALVKALVERRTFDAIKDLGTIYGHKIVPREIGLKTHRPDLLHAFGVAGTNAQYPFNARSAEAQADPKLDEAIAWIHDGCRPNNLAAEGWGARVYEAAEREQRSVEDAHLLTRSLIAAGVENTIIAIGNMLHAFAIHPDQWERLRDDPSLARNAVDEVMRWDGPTIQFYRTTFQEAVFGGVVVPAKSKVMLQIAAASHDPTRWPEPRRFDIGRNTAGHLGFGFGVHQCLGQIVARQQLSSILEALVRHARRIALDATPVRRLNNQSHGFSSLMISATPN